MTRNSVYFLARDTSQIGCVPYGVSLRVVIEVDEHVFTARELSVDPLGIASRQVFWIRLIFLRV